MQSSSASKCSESKRSANRLDLIWVRPAAPALIAQDKQGALNSSSCEQRAVAVSSSGNLVRVDGVEQNASKRLSVSSRSSV